MDSLPKKYELEKSIWTEADYEQMGWHDSSIHAFCFQEAKEGHWTGDFLLDIDYIFQWVEPGRKGSRTGAFAFWIAPCTLRFSKAFKVSMQLQTEDFALCAPLIDNLHLHQKEPMVGGFTYHWELELHNGTITFTSEGYTQTVRNAPIYTNFSGLTLEQRGQISFSEEPFK